MERDAGYAGECSRGPSFALAFWRQLVHYDIILKLKSLKPFVLGALSAIALLVISVLIYLRFFMAPLDLYPAGGSKHKMSPDGRWEAKASNLSDKVFTGEIVSYFEFSVIDKHNGEPIVVHRFPQSVSKVQFRGGNGEIFWTEDSSKVRFGSEHEVLWEYEIAQQDSAEQSATTPESKAE